MVARLFASLLVSALLVVASAQILSEDEYKDLFFQWTKLHGKTYADAAEHDHRYNVFKANRDFIFRHNAKNKSYTLAMNKFGDLTHAEFRDTYARMDPSWTPVALPRRETVHSVENLPTSVNWTAEGRVNEVINQGQCGSCWAITTAEAIASAHAIKYKTKPVELSAQELMDCSDSVGNYGCNGGSIDPSYQWVMQQGGLCSAAEYPYQAQDGTCEESKCKPQYNISGYVDVPANNEAQMQAAVAKVPIQAVIDATSEAFQFYEGGIIDEADCGTQICHTLLVTGYGELDGKPYWIAMNSWGASWGLQGYLLLARNIKDPAGECGLAMQPSYVEA